MSDWQPIETAPVDGSTFLACGDDFGSPFGGQHIVMAAYCAKNGMICEHGDEASRLPFLTHWQPLPAPAHRKERDTHE